MIIQVKKLGQYLIGYNDVDYKIEPLHIMLPETSAYLKS